MPTNAKNTKNRQQTRTDPIQMVKNITSIALCGYFYHNKRLLMVKNRYF